LAAQQQVATVKQQLLTVEHIATMLATDVTGQSCASDNLAALLRLLVGFLMQWHHGTSKGFDAFAGRLNCITPALPPFPAQLCGLARA
jgi:hypothetical protein